MNNGQSCKRAVSLSIILIMVIISFVFSGCEKVEEKAQGAAEYAKGAVDKATEFAGEVTANWLGTTAANVGKDYNEAVVERLGYLNVSVDQIESKTKGKQRKYTIKLILNNTAPGNEKLYAGDLLNDHYLVACDQSDYVYSLSKYEDPDEEDWDENPIVPGKSRLTVYTSTDKEYEIGYLLYLNEKVPLPAAQ